MGNSLLGLGELLEQKVILGKKVGLGSDSKKLSGFLIAELSSVFRLSKTEPSECM